MPNWCQNTTFIYGDKKQLKQFQEMLEKQTSVNRDPKIENDWDEEWLGNVFYHFYTKEEIEKYDIRCRGCFNYIEYNDDCIQMQYETAWSPNIESWERLLNDYFPKLKQATQAEEIGMSIYVVYDPEHLFFSDKWLFDSCYQGDYYTEYFDTDEALVKYINETFGQDFKNVDQILSDKTFAESFNVEPEDYYGLYQFEEWY